ncbi:hypothetical protein PRJ39_21875 [Lysobacter enzymogenes]|uniref:hypothetical protein n=1 Tax=Lysobacter enzymogenes TaxID=69 RepID=UPI003748C1D9
MAEPMPSQLRALVDELPRQKNIPPGAARDVETAILTSPYLASVMVDAANQKILKHIGVSHDTHEGGHYDSATGTVFISVDSFTDKAVKAQARLDNITNTLGHETGHALTAKQRTEEVGRLANAIEIRLAEGVGNASYVDVTADAERYLNFTRGDEALSELIGMNSVASRVASTEPGGYTQARFLRRVDASTRCVDTNEDSLEAKLAPGIRLGPRGYQLTGNRFNSPAVEAVAACHYDRGATLGPSGDSNYRNYYGPSVLSTIAAAHAEAAKGTTQAVPEVRLDLKRLKLDLAQIERNGVDLGSPGKRFSFTDTSDGKLEWKTVRDTSTGPSNPPPKDVDIDAPAARPAFRADSPGHPDHRGFEMFHGAIKADGRWSEAESRNLAAAGLAAVKADPIVGANLTGVAIGKAADGGTNLIGFASPHGQAGPHHHLAIDAGNAAQVPAETSLERVERLNQQQARQQAQAPTQDPEGPTGARMTL